MRHCASFSVAACLSACCSGVSGCAVRRRACPPAGQARPRAALRRVLAAGGTARAAAAAERGHRRRARQGFAMVRHQLRLAQADLDIRLDDGLRVGAGDGIEAVGDGADLHARRFSSRSSSRQTLCSAGRTPARSFPNLVLYIPWCSFQAIVGPRGAGGVPVAGLTSKLILTYLKVRWRRTAAAR